MDSKDALIKSLNKRIGAMKKISRVASFKPRQNIANGIFMSKLIYLMPVWKGCDDYLTNHCRSARTRLLAVIDEMSWR